MRMLLEEDHGAESCHSKHSRMPSYSDAHWHADFDKGVVSTMKPLSHKDWAGRLDRWLPAWKTTDTAYLARLIQIGCCYTSKDTAFIPLQQRIIRWTHNISVHAWSPKIIFWAGHKHLIDYYVDDYIRYGAHINIPGLFARPTLLSFMSFQASLFPFKLSFSRERHQMHESISSRTVLRLWPGRLRPSNLFLRRSMCWISIVGRP